MSDDERKVKVVVLKSFFVRGEVQHAGTTIEVTEAQAKNFVWTGQVKRAGKAEAKPKPKAKPKKGG